MKILVIGQGGREHALLASVKKSAKAKKLYCAPGNGGTAQLAENIAIKADDVENLADFCEKENMGLTIVGPEAPLAVGIVDAFNKRGLRIFGPTKATSKLEVSKIFTKELCRNANIPTAAFEIFDDAEKAKDFVKNSKKPIVIKADGLAAGKGVTVAETEEEAFNAIDDIMVRKIFGASGERIIVEDCLKGEEASIIVISDGTHIAPLASSQDHKRALDGDKGPNTGGMGAYSPAPVVTEEVFDRTIKTIIEPAIKALERKGTPHKGVLYAGVMVDKGEPKLLEFNARFGDPETQAILPRLESDLIELIEASIDGRIDKHSLKWKEKACVSVVLASGGYPGKYDNGKEIKGLDEAASLKDIFIFHAGTKLQNDKKVITNGGRVLNVVSLGDTIEKAAEKAYKACADISFENMYYRKDIGYKAIKRGKR